jgi:hypothetical protein
LRKKSKKDPEQTQHFIKKHVTRNKELPQVRMIIRKIIHNGIRPSRVRKLCRDVENRECKLALRFLSKIRRDHGLETAKSIVQPIIPEL